MANNCYDTSVTPGETWIRDITWTDSAGEPIDLTGYTASMPIKQGAAAVTTLTHTAGITLGGSAGTIVLTIAATATDDLPPGTLSYDLWLTSPGGVVRKLLCGELEVLTD